jgi:predicted amidohydrolase YtcJ
MNQRGRLKSGRPGIAHTAARAMILVLYSCTAALLATGEPPPPDVIYTNANIYTVDPNRPRAEALAIAGNRIVAVGSSAEVLKLRQPDTRIRDLGGKTVLPGLIDAHGHIGGLGIYGLGRLDLSRTASFDDVLSAVAERVKSARKGEWILGGRWDHESWPGRRLPTHHKLSELSPDNPVWLTRVDGHAGLANAAAMRHAGVTRETKSPSGGEIVRDEHGEPTGLFIDNAEEIIARHIDQPAHGAGAAILKAQEMCLSVGLTGVHDAGVTPGEVELYRELAAGGRLKLRIYAMIAGRYAIDYFTRNPPLIDERLTVRACKLYADGALGSRGAWLLEAYADRPVGPDGQSYTGLCVTQPEFLRQVAEHALQHGYQVCTHAIGDRANRTTLDAYALALSRHPRENHRFRIEHAQLLHEEDIPRFAKMGVIPSMQPTHCTSDMRWVEDRVGPQRARGAYAWAGLLRSGARIAAGSDFPVESHNPFLGLYAAITRQNEKGEPPAGWRSEQRMTREEALRAFTLDAARAAFEEELKGSLTAGKLADFVVIDRDVMTCEPREILQTRVLMTVIGGEAVYGDRGP